MALPWVRFSWDVEAVASRWDNNTAGHLGHLYESHSGHLNSRDCLTQGDLKLRLDPCLDPFHLCFPHNCASSSLLVCLWVASQLLRAASCYSLDNFPLKPTLENLFSLLFSLHLAIAVDDHWNSQCSGTEVRLSFEKGWKPQFVQSGMKREGEESNQAPPACTWEAQHHSAQI